MYQKIKFSLSIFFLFAFATILLVAPISPTDFDIETSYQFYPDLLTCLIFAILINRPKLCPPYIILLIYVLSDIILMKPIGLYCALIFMAAELIRKYNQVIRKESFLVHWLIFLSCLAVIQVIYVSVHKLFFMPSPQLILLTKQFLLTAFFYPLFDLPLKFLLRKEY